MTRLSQYFLPTVKEAPADAEAVSHRLLVRAGLARQVGAGLWTWLPAGWRSHRRVEQIIREELEAIGCWEMLMPVLQPAELWKRSERYDIDEVFKLRDRRDAELVLAMSHEENITFHMAREVRSYRDLPKLLYHFQTKERDEPRPRAGVLRTREFIMKDAYSFDRDREGLDRSYDQFVGAYDRIFDRSGLEWYRVESDVGAMGGFGAHEYMAPCAAGENDVALTGSGYAANVEVASATPQPVDGLPEGLDAPERAENPGRHHGRRGGRAAGGAVRGDHQGLPGVRGGARPGAGGRARGPPTERDQASERARRGLPPGGGRGGQGRVRRSAGLHRPRRGARGGDRRPGAGGAPRPVAGGNERDVHLKGVEPGRDFEPTWADVRSVEAGDTAPDGAKITIEPAIEVGNIFKLGLRYSEPLGARYLDEQGKEQHIWMGSYGIGPARVVAAAVEQGSDEQGIAWPRAVAPFDVELVTLGKEGEEARTVAERLYEELKETGLDVLYDDRTNGAGEKFAEAELLGCPLRVTVGKRSIESGELEVQVRRGQEQRSVPLDGAAAEVAALWRGLP